MSLVTVFPDKVDGQTVTASELNGLKNEISKALDKIGGDTAPGALIFDDLTISLTGAGVLKYEAATVSRGSISWVSTADKTTGLPDFVIDTLAPTTPVWTQREVVPSSSVKGLIGKLFLPHLSELGGIILAFKAASGHSALPANQPVVYLIKKPILGGVSSVDDSASNLFVDYLVYQASTILISLTAPPAYVIDSENYEYYAVFQGESGADAVAGLKMYGALWFASVSEQDKG